jgi:hypothetical protein
VKYYQTEPDSAAQVKDYVTSDLDIGWMVAANTLEVANNAGLHYNDHKLSISIYHWISIYGYSSYGDTLLFQDPVGGSTAVSWSAGVARTFSMTDDKTYSVMKNSLGTRGFAW